MSQRSVMLAMIPIACALGACAVEPPPAPPYRPASTVRELMESIVAHSAEVYWASVSIIVDDNGINELYPESDEEWEEVWAAAIGLSESGNLLMMPPRALNDPDWTRFSAALIDVGRGAAEAALARDPDAVLDMGERVYNVCLDCHERFVPSVP